MGWSSDWGQITDSYFTWHVLYSLFEADESHDSAPREAKMPLRVF